MGIDTIIFAVVAVLALARLWMVLGQRNEQDRRRPNPFAAPPPVKDPEPSAADPPRGVIAFKPLAVAPASLAGGLEQVRSIDPLFDEKQFLQDVRVAFSMIVEEFAKGDLSRSTTQLGALVLTRFQAAIAARRAADQSMEGKVVRIKDVETVAARAEATKAVITVRIMSDQENVLRDSGGTVIAGEPGKVEEIIDVWTFARDTKANDPNWILIETKS